MKKDLLSLKLLSTTSESYLERVIKLSAFYFKHSNLFSALLNPSKLGLKSWLSASGTLAFEEISAPACLNDNLAISTKNGINVFQEYDYLENFLDKTRRDFQHYAEAPSTIPTRLDTSGRYGPIRTTGYADQMQTYAPTSSYALKEVSAPSPKSKPKENLFLETEQLADTGSWAFDLATAELHCSANVYRLLQISPEEKPVNFLSFLSYIVEEDHNTLKENWKQTLYYGQALDQTTRLQDATSTVWIRIKAKPIYNDNKICRIIGILQDVTEWKENEILLLEQKNKAEQVTKVKSEFVSLMSHEIRTPLNAIMGLTYLLLQDENLEGENKEHLQSIHFSSQNLLSLINSTLDFSRIEAGKIELENVNFPLQDLLKGIHRSLYLRATEKQLAFELVLDPQMPEEVAGDPARLTQILNNLTSNAIKFTDRGSVKLSAEVIYQSDKDWLLEFSITDTGVGIPKDRQQSIFESYVQASASTHRQYGGTGLGLAITKKIVELYKGNIQVSSTPGKGSVFSVRLRFFKPQPSLLTLQKDASSDSQYFSLTDAKILVIDDNVINKMVASKLLMSWQAKVETAEDGLAALEKIKFNTYDLILMDLQMPVMNGFEAIAEIRKLGLQMPIIALTANASEEEKNRILALGGNDYITKPFVPQELYYKLQQHLYASIYQE